jgi:hypothetical protein
LVAGSGAAPAHGGADGGSPDSKHEGGRGKTERG